MPSPSDFAQLHPWLLGTLLALGVFGYAWGSNLDRINRWLNR